MSAVFVHRADTPEGKYLVVRRDGSIPPWPHFVLSGDDRAAPAALYAYAAAAGSLGYADDFVQSVRKLADEYAARPRSAASDPDAGPHRQDNPVIVGMMRGVAGLDVIGGVGMDFTRLTFPTWRALSYAADVEREFGGLADDAVIADLRSMADAFARWEEGVRTDPTAYMQDAERIGLDVSSYGALSAAHFMSLLRLGAASEAVDPTALPGDAENAESWSTNMEAAKTGDMVNVRDNAGVERRTAWTLCDVPGSMSQATSGKMAWAYCPPDYVPVAWQPLAAMDTDAVVDADLNANAERFLDAFAGDGEGAAITEGGAVPGVYAPGQVTRERTTTVTGHQGGYVTRAAGDLESMRAALNRAADAFEGYAEHHRHKGDVASLDNGDTATAAEAYGKAERNDVLAQDCRRAARGEVVF